MDHRRNELRPLCSEQPQYIVDSSQSSWCSLAVVGLSATAVLAYTFYPAGDVSTQAPQAFLSGSTSGPLMRPSTQGSIQARAVRPNRPSSNRDAAVVTQVVRDSNQHVEEEEPEDTPSGFGHQQIDIKPVKPVQIRSSSDMVAKGDFNQPGFVATRKIDDQVMDYINTMTIYGDEVPWYKAVSTISTLRWGVAAIAALTTMSIVALEIVAWKQRTIVASTKDVKFSYV
mmetsp:Transcript_118857/g.207052  ORF Transcript_118857/g.207052 Transcript_118857/m.207052 type:complete len:228 (-) Transcript_118857:622-1305(-)